MTFSAMLQRLDAAVIQIKRFTADASHELRGPLSFTRIAAEVALKNPHVDPESRRAFEDIVDEAAKASEVLEGLLTLARADSNSLDRTLESVDLAAVAQEACSMARPLALERNLSLSVSLTPVAKVMGDLSSLRRLLWILLDNALKYTSSPGQIDVVLATISGRATLTVRDTGIGISESDLPHILIASFEPIHREARWREADWVSQSQNGLQICITLSCPSTARCKKGQPSVWCFHQANLSFALTQFTHVPSRLLWVPDT